MKFYLGLLVGMFLNTTLSYVMSHNFKTPKYEVGACLSNGLYFEKITGIRYGDITHSIKYETTAYFGDGKSDRRLTTTDTWIAEENYVKVSETNCQERK